MTGQRAAFNAVATEAADRIAAVLADNPLRANACYPVGAVLAVVARWHDELRHALAELPEPITVDSAGHLDSFGSDVAGLLSFLELMRALYHGLDDIPDAIRVAANRNLGATHLIARRVRDGGRRLSGPR